MSRQPTERDSPDLLSFMQRSRFRRAPSSVLSTLQSSSPRLPRRALFRAHARADLVASRLEHRCQIVRPVVNRLVAYTCACACARACACACALACAWHARVHGMHLLPLAHRMHGEAGVAAPARGRLLNDLVEMAGRWRGGCEEMAGRSRGDCREIAGRWHRVVSPMVWCAIRREWGHGRHSHSKPSARAW